jgi:hypothetical protein
MPQANGELFNFISSNNSSVYRLLVQVLFNSSAKTWAMNNGEAKSFRPEGSTGQFAKANMLFCIKAA